MKVPKETEDQWKEDIFKFCDSDNYTGDLIRERMLFANRNAFYQGVIHQLNLQKEHYEDLLEDEENCTCLNCIINGGDDDGRGRDGLPLKPKPNEEEEDNLNKMWDKE